MSRIFISYKRNVEPDDRLASNLYSLLNTAHDVFIDKSIKIGSEWAKIIEEKLNSAEYFITLISKNSVESDMVIGEIETAYRLSKQNNGVPVILPVLVDFEESLKYPLSAYINRINWAVWKNESDTDVIFSNIKAVISKRNKTNYSRNPGAKAPEKLSVSQSPKTENHVETHLDLQPYVQRREERVIANYLKERGSTIIIKAPRYTGKRSLLTRVTQDAEKLSKKAVLIDFHLFDKSTLKDSDVFSRQFCIMVANQLDLKDNIDEYWATTSGWTLNCTRYFREYILEQIDSSFILILDEVEKLLEADFSSDFFGMLRGWHNSRAVENIWLNLSLVICISTEPSLLITDFTQSPFNIGHNIELTDFSKAEVHDLNMLYHEPFNKEQLEKVIGLLGGHVFLINQAMQIVTREHFSADELLEKALDDFGPFGDHLRGILFWIQKEENRDLLSGFYQVLNSNPYNEYVLLRLRGEGLVITTSGKITPRCKLYADYFRRKLKNLPQ